MEAGQVVDGHKLVQKLGEGGMGEVWLCQYLGTRFAVKFLKDREKAQQLQLEAIAQAKLSWMDAPEATYFVKIVHFNAQGEIPYLRMEYIEGPSLAKVIETAPMGVEQTLCIFEEMLKAMAFAHRNDCVHGDLKPPNLLLPTSGNPKVKIIDMGFGMAMQALMQEDQIERSYEQSAQQQYGFGTMLYAPPERFIQEFLQDKILAKTCDMFSLGKILYQALTAKKPTNVTPLERKIAGLPGGFDDFLLKCVENDPHDRYPSADAGLADWTLMKERAKETREPAPSTADIEFIGEVKPATTTVRTSEIEIVSALEVKQIRTLRGHKDAVTCVAFLQDGESLVSSGDDRTIKLWSLTDSRKIRAIVAHDDSVNAVASTFHGRILASGSDDRTAKLWVAQDDGAYESFTLNGHGGGVTSVAFTNAGDLLASGSYDRTVKIWQVETRQELASLKGHTDSVRCVAFSPDGNWLASASRDRAIRLWHTKTYKEAFTLTGHDGSVSAASFSPFGKILATGAYDGTVRMWNVDSGKEIAVLRGHKDYVRSVAFAPGGKILASAGSDKLVKLWDVATCEELVSLEGHAASVYWVAFSQQGDQIATAGLDRTVRLWQVTGQAL